MDLVILRGSTSQRYLDICWHLVNIWIFFLFYNLSLFPGHKELWTSESYRTGGENGLSKHFAKSRWKWLTFGYFLNYCSQDIKCSVWKTTDVIHWVSESCSVMSDSLWPHGLYRLWNSSGPNTGVGSLSLFQGIFPTQGSNPGLPHCRQIFFTSWTTREAHWNERKLFLL